MASASGTYSSTLTVCHTRHYVVNGITQGAGWPLAWGSRRVGGASDLHGRLDALSYLAPSFLWKMRDSPSCMPISRPTSENRRMHPRTYAVGVPEKRVSSGLFKIWSVVDSLVPPYDGC